MKQSLKNDESGKKERKKERKKKRKGKSLGFPNKWEKNLALSDIFSQWLINITANSYFLNYRNPREENLTKNHFHDLTFPWARFFRDALIIGTNVFVIVCCYIR